MIRDKRCKKEPQSCPEEVEIGHVTWAGRGQRVWFAGDRTNIYQAEMMAAPLPVSDWIRAAPKETSRRFLLPDAEATDSLPEIKTLPDGHQNLDSPL